MRDELHLMELVDRYLDGGMGEAERASFEERIGSNGELRTLVDDQRALREGLERVRLRHALVSAHRRWSIRRWAPWVAAGVFVLVGGAWLMRVSTEQGTRAEAPLPDTVDVRMGNKVGFQVADPIAEPAEFGMRVETVFTGTRIPARGLVDTGRGEGRIITRLITNEAAPVAPCVTAAPPADEEVPGPAFDSLPRWDAEDHRPGVRYKPSMMAGQDTSEMTVLATVERLENATKPEFPGGIEGLELFLRDNVKQPRGTKKAGTVIIGFTVNKKGEAVNTQVLRSLGRAYDAEALRVVSAMPDWAPSRIGDRAVKSKVQVRVRFLGSGSKRAAEPRARSPVEK